MPVRDGTGPEGTGPRGRRMGPCRGRNPAGADEVKNPEGTETQGNSTAVLETSTVYGAGRGGKPRGCGMGHCGGRRRNR